MGERGTHLENMVTFVGKTCQTFELCQISKGSVSYLRVNILPCSVMMRHQHILSFLCIYF
jgi:hypothetical protein